MPSLRSSAEVKGREHYGKFKIQKQATKRYSEIVRLILLKKKNKKNQTLLSIKL